jgi:hypothetical protein
MAVNVMRFIGERIAAVTTAGACDTRDEVAA